MRLSIDHCRSQNQEPTAERGNGTAPCERTRRAWWLSSGSLVRLRAARFNRIETDAESFEALPAFVLTWLRCLRRNASVADMQGRLIDGPPTLH